MNSLSMWFCLDSGDCQCQLTTLSSSVPVATYQFRCIREIVVFSVVSYEVYTLTDDNDELKVSALVLFQWLS